MQKMQVCSDMNRPFSPSIVVNLVDVYTFRSAMEIVSKIQSDVSIWFSKKTIMIEEFSNDNTKTVKILIDTDELLDYYYDVRDYKGTLVEPYEVFISANRLVSSAKTDGKKDGLVINVCVDPYTMRSTGLIILRQTATTEAVDPIPVLQETRTRKEMKDYYHDVFVSKGTGPNSKKSAEEFVHVLKMFKNKGERVDFIRKSESEIVAQCGITAANTAPTAALLGRSQFIQEVDPVIETESTQVVGGWLTVVQKQYPTISISKATINLLMQILKIGPKNVIKIFMDSGCPLVVVTNIGTYGKCILSFNSDLV